MLGNLIQPQPGARSRNSSWDRTGANADHVAIEPGATHTLLDVTGAGLVKPASGRCTASTLPNH